MNEKILNILEEVKDPEIPALSVVDMGIIRDIRENDHLEVDITPTYTGCPAMDRIESDIIEKLKEEGFAAVKINTVLSPPWTTDWISEDGLRRLEEFGIAPPVKGTADKRALFPGSAQTALPLLQKQETEMISAFGSTACKAQYKCNSCQEPFDYFKCI
jgi:ring-1,2-phenylacetyl-CoA epoxidase subunit PaaD